MKMELQVLLAIIGWFFCPLQTLAQTEDYSGSWLLNFEKSKLEHRREGLTGSRFVIRQQGDRFHLTRYQLFGARKKKLSFGMIADAKTRRVKLLFRCKLEWKEDGLWVTLWRKNFSNVVHYRFGKDQNELVADEVFKSKANNHHNIWVFDRER